MNSNVPPQPGYAPSQPVFPINVQPWTTGLCDCFEEPTNCIITCCLPCITFGRNAEIIDRGSTSCASNAFIYCVIGCTGCSCFYSYPYRTRLRGQFQLAEAPIGDCLLHCCCTSCALCQEHRELKNRGFDPTIGWQGKQGRSNYGANEPPPVQPDMKK